MIRRTLPIVVLCVTAAFGQTPAPKDVDIAAPDGIKLRATLFAAAKPGPAVMLLHMCNTTRKSWEPVAKELAEKGISALTIDNRGFGESGGPRFDGGSPEVRTQLRDKWAGDFDAAYEFLIAQTGVDKARIGAGGGSCGVTNAVALAERHPDLKVLVLLAGTTDVAGYNFILHQPGLRVFTAGAADDEFNSTTLQQMQWTSELSRNPRSKFEGFPDGRHGTEIFGPHPELVHHIAAFFVANLQSREKTMVLRKTPVAAFWAAANAPDGATRAAQLFHDARSRDPKADLFAEYPMNLLGYTRLQAGDNDGAIEIFKLNVEAYPESANAQDSLSDAYLAAGKKDLARAAEEKCLELLPGDKSINDPDFKAQLRKQAEDKIAKLKAGQ